jgi:hypothetical protein
MRLTKLCNGATIHPRNPGYSEPSTRKIGKVFGRLLKDRVGPEVDDHDHQREAEDHAGKVRQRAGEAEFHARREVERRPRRRQAQERQFSAAIGPPHSGMLSCFFQGSSSFLLRSIASTRERRRRVECGMFAIVVGAAIALDNLWQFAALAVLYIVIRWGVVAREEAYLTRKFGAAYTEGQPQKEPTVYESEIC